MKPTVIVQSVRAALFDIIRQNRRIAAMLNCCSTCRAVAEALKNRT